MGLHIEDDIGDDVVLVPPSNFSMVEEGIFRSSSPLPANFTFIESLNIRSIIYLCPEPYPEANMEFVRSHSIRLYHFGIQGKTEPTLCTRSDAVRRALKILIDVRNHPVLIHCRQGKHRTGSLVGCFRKLQNWCLSSIFEEYQHFAGLKAREKDLKFIETFDVVCLRQCVYSIIYQYQGYGSKKRRLVFHEDDVQKPSITSI